MSNRKKKALSGFAVAAVLLVLAGTYLHETFRTGGQTDPGISKDIIDKSRKIQEAMGALPRQPNADMQQISKGNRETKAKKSLYKEEAVGLSDIYSESGKEAVFSCFDKGASSYTWEIYNPAEKEWEPALETAVSINPDEFGREISWFKVSGAEEVAVRCILKYGEKEEKIQTASLHLLKGSIVKLSADDYVTEPDDCVCIKDIPITVTYKDQTEETLKGLNGLFFLNEEEKKEQITGIEGNQEETTITTVSERSYVEIGQEEKEVRMRYNGNQKTETVCTIKGEDFLPPVISSVEIAPFTVSNTDIPVTLTVAIDAKDNKTPYHCMDYAFVLADTPGDDIYWTGKSCFDVEITQNGLYAAYAKDEAGNTAKEELQIITVDMKPPAVQVSLENPTGWHQSNQIRVDARDAGKLQYSIRHTDDAAVPEWSDSNIYTAGRNGTYIVRVRDEAGNITETEITIDNIDREAPVIQGIHEK